MDIHTQNNHLKGTVFDCVSATKDSPIKRGIVTIDGTILRVAIFPQKISRSGKEYYPVRLQYSGDSRTVLKSIPVSGLVENRVI